MNKPNIPEQILLVSSRSDPAGNLIHEEVKSLLKDRPDLEGRYQHLQFDERLIYIDGQSLTTNADCILFLSRHASKEPRPVLTVHVTGNFGPADYGGTPETLTDAATGMMHAIMNRLAFEVPSGYAVSYEATHHGPTKVPVPSCFVELGSTEIEWQDRNAASAIARAVIGAILKDPILLAGFGGTHYAKRQTEITLTTRGAFGHIMPTRDLVHLNQEVFTAIIRSSGAEAVYIDRKSVQKEDIRRIERYAAVLELPVVGQSDLIELKNLPFDEYKKIRRLSEEILTGSLVHIHDLKQGSDIIAVPVASALIEEVMKVGPNPFIQALDDLPVAHLSGGGVACHPVFITSTETRTETERNIIRLCITILSEHFRDRIKVSESVLEYTQGISSDSLSEGLLEITEVRFNPVLARNLGVHEGKDFGILARGETLTIGEETITPKQVMEEYTRKITISYPDNSIPQKLFNSNGTIRSRF